MNDARLDVLRRKIDWNLACGALADADLLVTSDDGGFPVVVALEEEPLSILLGRLRAVGGYANLFVEGVNGSVRRVSAIGEVSSLRHADDRLLIQIGLGQAPPLECSSTTWTDAPTAWCSRWTPAGSHACATREKSNSRERLRNRWLMLSSD
ncbi:Uncharacterised protein [Mycobacteroides abscessus]|nr:Uncharacterised protein [Mycobacteroides abscessus]